MNRRKQHIAENITEIIGKTPLVFLNRLVPKNHNSMAAKLEYLNPGGSIKDRVAKKIIIDAQKRGLLKNGDLIVEPTGGNMGLSLAAVCAVLGYRLVLTMPDTAAVEHRKLLSAYGAQLVLTPAEEGMKGAIDKAEEIYKNNSDSFMPHQFINPSNPDAHEKTTAREIWADTRGEISALVGGIGTGGTITGIARYLKRQNKRVKIYGVEPEASAVLNGGEAGSHGIPGIGAGFIPETLNLDLVDSVLPVNDADAKHMCRELAQKEGILAGISSGAVCSAALRILQEENESLIVAVFPDSGTKYINMGLFT